MSTAALTAAAAVRFAERVCRRIELVVLDRELDVLHVAVVLLEPAASSRGAAGTPRAALLHLAERLRRADARDDVLALRVREELAVEALLAR